MPEFCLTTVWSIPAPVETVWQCLIDTETWPLWWKYVVAVEQTVTGNPSSGINNVRQYNWRTCLPYHLLLTLRVTETQPLSFVAVNVAGDLMGSGFCRLAYQPSTNKTQVEFQWHVKTCKPWMNWFSVLTRPIFAWNHERVMKQGEQDLIQYLSTCPR